MVLHNSILVYVRLNLSQGVTPELWILVVSDQLPRHGLLIFTVFLAHSFQPERFRVIGNRIYFILALFIVVVTFLPGGMEYVRGEARINYGLLYHISNSLQLGVVFYTWVTAMIRVPRVLAPSSQMRRLMNVMNILNPIFIPGYVYDFIFAPLQGAAEGGVFPLIAFFRLHFLALSFAALFVFSRTYLEQKSPNLSGEPVPLTAFSQRFGLSQRETTVLEMVCLGHLNKEISARLFVSVSTIKSHIYSIFQKTGAGNRVELVNLTRYREPPRDQL